MASMAQIAEVSVTDTAVHKRFPPEYAGFLRRLLEEISAVVGQAAESVAIDLLQRCAAVILEDSSVFALSAPLHELWSGCGNQNVLAY
jgi:hypothetical protein